MLYRRSSPNPPTLLLRIVASAGASAIVGTAACSGTDPVMGSVASVADSGDEPVAYVTGSLAMPPPDADASGGPCNGGPCGTVAMPPPDADAGSGPCNGGPCGTVAMPPSDADAGSGPCNGGPCGTVAMPPSEDAGAPDGHAFYGTMAMPPEDAGRADASHCCIGVVVGVTRIPDGGIGGGIMPHPGDAGTRPCDGLPCGLIIHPDGGA